MTSLRAKLAAGGMRGDVAEFACSLLELLEFEGRLTPPEVSRCCGGVSLTFRRGGRELVTTIRRTGEYMYSAIDDNDPAATAYGVVRGGELVQHLRNLLFWLWDEPW